MNVHAILLAANAGWPGLEPLAARYGIPVVVISRDEDVDRIAAGVIDQACVQAQRGSSTGASGSVRARAAVAGFTPQQVAALGQAFGAGRVRGIAVLFGEANPKQTFFERTLALMEAALAERAIVLVGGGLGAELEALQVELGKRQEGMPSAFAAELDQTGLAPVSALGSAFELPRVVSLGQSIPLVFAFPEFYRASTWACATSMLSLGFPVQIGVRLPFWGSPELANALLTEWPRIAGGRLLAAPALPDARAQAEELAAQFRDRRA